MSTAPRRPFRLLDAMVLVAATAVGLGAARGMQDILRDSTDMDASLLANPVGRSLPRGRSLVCPGISAPYLGVNLGMPGLAVTVAWTGLALSGRWQPEPNWLDRAGRLIGLAWVGLMIFQPWLISIVRGDLS